MPLAGVDVGGTKCLGVVVDDHGSVLAEHRVATPADADRLIDAIVEVAGTLGVGRALDGLGVGVPGLVDRRGVLRFAPNLPAVRELDVAGRVAAGTGLAVRVDNDATCATWGEQQMGAGRGVADVLLVTLGTGIGGGVVSDGRLVRGGNGFAGEIGHMVVDPNGPRCPCGQRGCWERFASGSGLGRLAREAAHAGEAPRVVVLAGGDAEDVRGEHVTQAAAEGDEAAIAVMGRFAWWLALGLANLANVLDPALIVLGGGLTEAGDVLLTPARTAFLHLIEAADHRPDIPIVLAHLGEHAGAIGAALLAGDRKKFA